jgi:putative intracellular protease/amidase
LCSRWLKRPQPTTAVTEFWDLRNAGAEWVDEEVVIEGELVSSRKPEDAPAFNRGMIDVFTRTRVRA